MPDIDITKLRKLLGKATPGPWIAMDADNHFSRADVEITTQVRFDESCSPIAEIDTDFGVSDMSGEQEANAALIAAAVNALPGLLDECERLRGPIRTSEAIDWRLTAAEIEAQYRAMAQECERLRADAARYRWLRDRADTPAICAADDDGWYPLIGAAIEAAVDKAMQEQPR